MIDISVGDITSKVLQPRKHMAALAKIRDVCKAKPADYMHMPKYKAGLWDGYISLMTGMSSFPTGLLSIIIQMLDKHSFQYNLIHTNSILEPVRAIEPESLRGVVLRDYQIRAANAMIDAGRGVAKMATNAGKTEVMAAVLYGLSLPPSIIVVHRKELMYQTAERLNERLGVKIGLIGDSVYKPDRITVAMVQTLQTHLTDELLHRNRVLIVDECHHVSSDQMLDVVFGIAGHYRYGLSGTPLKYDLLSDMKLIAATGGILVDVDNNYMIEAGYSAKPTIHLKVIELDDDDLWGMDYAPAYSELIVNNDARNEAVRDYAKSMPGITLIIVNILAHGYKLKSMIDGAVFVHGSMSAEARREVLDAMRAYKQGIFIASPIFDEGVDVPSINNLVLACGGKSTVKLLQRLGRGLRAKDGDNVLHILDFLDDTNKYLLEHSEHRIDTYVAEGFETEIG